MSEFTHEHIHKALQHLNSRLRNLLVENAQLEQVPSGTEILREGQFVKVIPFVISGLVKVFTRHEDKELLLYYIQPDESCIMSFSASLHNSPSRVFAKTEEDSEILLVSVDKIALWRAEYPDINDLFFQQFNLRYADLLETIHHVIFDKLDVRLQNYLREKVQLTKHNPIKISHRQIATELGTSREVVTRVLKKLESEGLIEQSKLGIKLPL